MYDPTADLFLIRDEHKTIKDWLEKDPDISKLKLSRERHTHPMLREINRETMKWSRRKTFTFDDIISYIFQVKLVRLSASRMEDRQKEAVWSYILKFGLDVVLTALDILMEEDSDLLEDLTNLSRFTNKAYHELLKEGFYLPVLNEEGKIVR